MYPGTTAEFLNMGGGEITLILVVVLLLFGGKKLPELARGLGKGIRDFKDASEGVKREIHRNINAMDIDEEDKTEPAAHSRRLHPEEGSEEHVSSDYPVHSDYPADPANVDPLADRSAAAADSKEPQENKA
ncbi:twin-arginine translocase TatA/TatE family subunit [Pedobacter yulinensis]|uniref:Sec-independent protein translocase protein TatA n=2 Tax=Pedobacter yulinensis TaxID=2126353 RepID=A0A2T3HQK0_9SPHI|nr:twin-arginine translocase TatA/TatE family subunit [Pedobacter yulinensis]